MAELRIVLISEERDGRCDFVLTGSDEYIKDLSPLVCFAASNLDVDYDLDGNTGFRDELQRTWEAANEGRSFSGRIVSVQFDSIA